MGIKIDVDDVVEPYVMQAGSEVTLRITQVRKGINKSGGDYFMPVFEVVDEVGAKEFSFYLGIPNESMTPKQQNAAKYNYLQFCNCFELDPAQEWEPEEDWVGATGQAIVGVTESDDYGEQNVIKKFL
jgi:hypothetical protein